MKQRILRYSICVSLFLLALACAFYFSPPAQDMRRIRRHIIELRNALDLRDVALGCLALIQSGSSETILDPTPTDERLPAAIRSKNPRWVSIDPTDRTVSIEFGGGFDHYGYLFEPVSSGTGQWRLSFYGEEPDDLHELLRL